MCPSPALSGLFDIGFTLYSLEAQMRTPVWFEVSMMSRELLTRTPLKQRIRDARGDNFTKDQVMYQVSEATHPCSLAPRSKLASLRPGSTTTPPGFSYLFCGPEAGLAQVAPTLMCVDMASSRAAHPSCPSARATSNAALVARCSCRRRITARGGSAASRLPQR